MFKPHKLWSLCIIGLIVANAAYLSSNFIGWVITLSFFLLVPGYLLLKILKLSFGSRWETLSLSLGLSILLVMLGGLALNETSIFGVSSPLITRNIFIMLDVLVLALLAFCGRQTFAVPELSIKPSKSEMIMTAALTLLPILAVGGAIRLNNGASNILIVVLFTFIMLLFVLLVFMRNLKSLYPYAIVMMSLSLLLATSLRGWFITGHDIQREFYVFQLTSSAGYWNLAKFRDPYNACLSITILPTIFAKITSISQPYIYKVVFQTIFAVGLAPIFLFMKRISGERIALLGAFLFVSFPTFLSDMPFLNRQEIALIFFTLLLLVNFMNMAKRSKAILSILMILGLILSHYSSSYVALGILFLAWIFCRPFRRRANNLKTIRLLPFLSLPIILIALLLTFLWNTQVTNTTSGLQATLSSTVTGVFDQSSSYHFGAEIFNNPQKQLQSYAGNDATNLEFINQPEMGGNKVSDFISEHFLGGNDLSVIDEIIQARTVELLFIIALSWSLIKLLRKDLVNYELIALNLAGLTLLAVQILFPTLSIDYGTERFLQQILIISGVPIILVLLRVFRFTRINTIIVVAFLLLLFSNFSGLLPQAFGHYPAQLALNNTGLYYDNYYVHKGEILSGQWMSANVPTGSKVLEDYSSLAKLIPITNGKYETIDPFVDTPEAYYYEDNLNVSSSLYTTNTIQSIIYYQLKTDQSANRDLLYANENSKIYSKRIFR